MWANISIRDKSWFLVLLACMLYFFVLFASGCQVVDSPLGFVRGCKNYGIDWNTFMAPLGMLVLLLAPLSILYWFLRIIQILYSFGRQQVRRKKSG